MDYFQPSTLNDLFLVPAVIAIVVYGFRYAAMASTAYLVVRSGWGRAHANAPMKFDTWRNVRREISYSGVTVLIFGLVNAILFGFGLIHHSQVYYRVASFPLWWFWASIVVMLILHDTLFYWIHRAMHSKALFAVMHRVHHQSVYPTAFAAYSFHPSEALAEALIVTAIVFIIPVHPMGFIIFQTISSNFSITHGSDSFAEG